MELLREFLAMEGVILGCAFLSGTFIGWIVLEAVYRGREAHQRVSQDVVLTDTRSFMMRQFLPLARMVGLGVGELLGRQSPKSGYAQYVQRVQRRLAAAGTPEGINADEFVGFLLLQSGLFGILGLVGLTLYAPDASMTMTAAYAFLGCAFLGGMLRNSWLTRQIQERQFRIRASLPFALDLLTLSMEAGLDFTAALSRIAPKLGESPLGREFALMMHEIQLGKSRSDALRDLSTRVDLPEVRSVVGSLVQAEELGASLSRVMRIQAAQQREKRSQRAEEMAMKAPVKMLGPLLIILVAVMLIVLGPIGMQLLQQF